MSAVPVAATWAGAGLLAALLIPRLRRRRLAVLVPLAAAVAALLSLGGGGDLSAVSGAGGLALGRPAGGVVLLSALAVTMCLLIAPPLDDGEILVIGACGALSSVALATGSPLVWGVCFLGGSALLGIRWMAAAPARATLAAGRVATLGASALIGASPFLPVDPAATAPRAHLAGGLLAAGIAAGFALLPLGGWVTGGGRLLRGAALMPWALLLLPALLLTTQSLPLVLPPDARGTLGSILLAGGAVSAAWAAVRGLAAPAPERYARVLLADLGLVAMGLATSQPGARLGSLLLMLTHLCTGPLLLHDPSVVPAGPRRLAWLALCGVPPSPAFWGRFALIASLTAGFGAPPLLAAMPVAGILLVIAFRAVADASATRADATHGQAARIAAWLPPLAALCVGLLPDTALRSLLGVG